MSPSAPSVVAFIAVLIAVVGAIAAAIAATAAPHRRRHDVGIALIALAAWMGLTGAIIGSGVLAGPGSLPRPLPFLAGQALVMFALAASPIGARLARLPLASLIGFQAFRLPLEAVLHQWYLQGVVPVQMTWSGANLDVISGFIGLLALAAGRWGPLGRGVGGTLNTVGFVLLLNVMRIAVRSIPSPFRAYPGEPLLLPFSLPYGWIVSVCVMGALLAHLITFRALAARRAG